MPFQCRCSESRWTGAGLPGDHGGQRGLVGHSGKGGAAQSFPYPKGTSELRSCEKTVILGKLSPYTKSEGSLVRKHDTRTVSKQATKICTYE